MQTLCDILDQIRRDDRPDLLHVREGDRFRAIGATEFLDDVARCEAVLADIGIGPGDRLGIVSANRPEWHVIDFACHRRGAIVVPLFPTLTAPEVAFCFGDSGCAAVMVDGAEQLEKICVAARDLPDLRAVLVADQPSTLPPVPDHVRVVGLREALDAAQPAPATPCPGNRDTVATIIYTSGTTGTPKGVMLTHGNFLANVEGVSRRIAARPEDLGLSLLPLSHSFERTVDYSYLIGGASIAYSSPQEASADFRLVQPTIMIGVPRLYQKMRAAIEERAAESGPVARELFRRAVRVGRRRAEARLGGPDDGLWNRLEHRVLDGLVLSRIREATGGRLRLMASGGAALDAELNWWFLAVGWDLTQGYGLTESSPIIATNSTEGNRIGSVGPPLDNVEVEIAGDGEVLTRGPHVMKGYWNRPDATDEAIQDGWLRTGDVGRLDADGYLYITDRKKSLLVTSTGKKVAPQPLENQLLRSGWVEQIMVVGDDRRFVAALIVPVRQKVLAWGARAGLGNDYVALLASSRLHDEIRRDLDLLQADFAPYEQVREFRLLPEPLTIESGQLTPTLKVVRRNVERDYAQLIEEIYAD